MDGPFNFSDRSLRSTRHRVDSDCGADRVHVLSSARRRQAMGEVGLRAADTARAAGCDAYITRPISPRQVLAKVREHLSPLR